MGQKCVNNVLGHANYPPPTTQTCALCYLFCVLLFVSMFSMCRLYCNRW